MHFFNVNSEVSSAEEVTTPERKTKKTKSIDEQIQEIDKQIQELRRSITYDCSSEQFAEIQKQIAKLQDKRYRLEMQKKGY